MAVRVEYSEMADRAETDAEGTTRHYRGQVYHRDGGLPAIEHADGGKEWWVDGVLHRDDDLPALRCPDIVVHASEPLSSRR